MPTAPTPHRADRYARFETAIGTMGLSWSPNGIRRVRLPEPDPEDLVRHFEEAGAVRGQPAGPAERAIAALREHLDGGRARLGALRLDDSGIAPFRRTVYREARRIPRGRTRTYAELADAAGSPRAFRAVAGAMAANPWPVVVPCHRVVAAGGKPGGFSAAGGLLTKARLLGIEGVDLPLPLDRARAVRELRATDPRMRALVDAVGPLRMDVTEEGGPWEALFRAIVYQQLSGHAAAAIHRRVCEGLGGGVTPTPAVVLRASDPRLREHGLSAPKIAAIRDLARRVEDGTVPPLAMLRGLPDDEIVERLVTVRGIGRWTVEMFLMFRLGRPDVLPVDDYGVRKGFAIWYGGDLPKPRDLARFGERWAPWRSAASWYLWRATEGVG